MKFALIDAENANHGVAIMCRVLSVSRSGYYAWRVRPESERSREDTKLRVLVREAHELGRQKYGRPRIHRALKNKGEKISGKRVMRLMHEEKIVGRLKRRFKCTTNSEHDQPVAPNLLNQEFTATAKNQRWVGDTTELRIGPSGDIKLYLAAILDLYSRFVVGWALSSVNDRHLALKALDMAVRRRRPADGLVFHSDRGSPYASEDYQAKLTDHGIICSMSRKGNCYDNAAMESWFATFKAELGERFESYATAKTEIFDYVEAFYNTTRMHSSLDYASPAEFEAAA